MLRKCITPDASNAELSVRLGMTAYARLALKQTQQTKWPSNSISQTAIRNTVLSISYGGMVNADVLSRTSSSGIRRNCWRP